MRLRIQLVFGYKPMNGIKIIITAKNRASRKFAPILNFAQIFDLLFAICQSANLEKYRIWVIVERISVRHNSIPPILEIAHEPSCSNPITSVMIEIDPPITTMVVLTMDEYQ